MKKFAIFCALLVSILPLQAATFQVNSLTDATDGVCDATNCTLREAISAANAASDDDVIQFASNVMGIIQLANPLPPVTTNVSIEGPGASLLSIEGNNSYAFRVLAVTGGTSSIRNLTLRRGSGGGIYNNANLTIENCIISDNSTQTDGAGIYNYDSGTLNIKNCAILNNSAVGQGGGILSKNKLSIDQTTISGNSSSHGGGIYNVYGDFLCTNSTISGNSAGRGGGVESITTLPNDPAPASTFMSNCTISGNSAYLGGGFENSAGLSTLQSCTVFQNNVSPPYNTSNTFSGIYNSGTSSISTELKNSIVSNNGNVTHDVDYAGSVNSFVSQGYNLVGYGNAASAFNQPGDQVGSYLVLGALADNGGPTKTHAILANSPAINAGDPAFAAPPDFDQRGTGFPRVQGARIDIGAFESSVQGLSINDISVSEGNSGTKNATFTVVLSAATNQTVTVNYATANGTAVSGTDFTTTSGSLTFAPSQTSKTITVPIIGDTLDEDNETFFVNLSSASGASIADAQGLCTILDDDAAPNLKINDITVTEGTSSNTNATFTVTLSPASGRSVMVDFVTANGSAIQPDDYNSISGTLTFAAGETVKTITVAVNGDTSDENNETFYVNLSKATNSSIADSQGKGTINDNDALPTLSIADATPVIEDGAGARNSLYVVTLSGATNRVVKVNYATGKSIAVGSATPGVDFTAVSGTMTFTPGQTTKTIVVPVLPDNLDEANEAIYVNLSYPIFASITRSQGQGSITDNDATPTLSLNDVTQAEGNSGTTNFVFTVSLSAVSGQTVTVSYQTDNGTAIKPGDYTGKAGTLTFAPGETTKTIAVPVIGNTVNEPDETFFVNLSSATNATLSDGQGQGTILNDDTSG